MNTSVQARWLGHSAFQLQSPNDQTILIDPFLKDNPTTPDNYKEPDDVDHILLTHGHEDHVGDTIELANRTDCTVLANIELISLLTNKPLSLDPGLNADQCLDPNKGGTVDFDEFLVTLVSANHSSTYQGDYAGEPGGLVIDFDDDLTIYDMGDTNIFADIELYGQLYEPNVVFAPMGDHYTMGPKEAAWAVEMTGADVAIPIHYGTFPPLTGDPEVFKAEVEQRCDTEVIIPDAGENFLAG